MTGAQGIEDPIGRISRHQPSQRRPPAGEVLHRAEDLWVVEVEDQASPRPPKDRHRGGPLWLRHDHVGSCDSVAERHWTVWQERPHRHAKVHAIVGGDDELDLPAPGQGPAELHRPDAHSAHRGADVIGVDERDAASS